MLSTNVTVTIPVTKPDKAGNTFNLRLVDDGTGGIYVKTAESIKDYRLSLRVQIGIF